MRNQSLSSRLKLLTLCSLLTIAGTLSVWASGQANPKQSAVADLRGTWSGSFFSEHGNIAPFTMTVVITPDASGHLVGTSSMSSDCLHDVRLQVTVTGSQVVLAGSSEIGDNITVRASLDDTGTNLKGSYILNGSASGKCETDNGMGNLAKR